MADTWEMSYHVNTDRGRCKMGEFIRAKLGIGPQEGMKAQSLTAVPPIKIDFPIFLFWVFLCGSIDFKISSKE